MLDVHPPHAPTHTWRDFFIHVGTICIGLLIAVGLEQSVEAVHRAKERRELLHDIHAECESNLKTLAPDITAYRELADWETHAASALRVAPIARGTITVTLPAYMSPPAPPRSPSRAVWAMAKSSGKIALLPDNLAEILDRVDLQAEQFRLAADRTNTAKRALATFELKTGTTVQPGATLHLTPTQRDELLATLALHISEALGTISWAASWEGASQAVLHGVTGRDEMDAYMFGARAAHKIT